MFTRLLIVLVIALIGSLIWYPGLYDASHIEAVALKETLAFSNKVSDIGILPSGVQSSLVNSAQNLLPAAQNAVSTVLGFDPFPSQETIHETEEAIESSFSRAFSSPYFLSMRALLEVAVLRGIIAFIWFAALMPIFIGVLYDALMVRRLKFESFAINNPIFYQTLIGAPWVLLGMAFCTFLIPSVIPTLVPVVFYLLFLTNVHLLVSHFHRFG